MLELFAERVAIIERIGCERVIIEICATRGEVEKLTRNFGGTFKRVPRTLSFPRSKPLKVGTRLVITDGRSRAHWGSRRHLIIPAAGAFGTGEHATTAMCLRLIEKVTRRWRNDWIMLDAGTGSGILALAGRCLGAARVIAIDNDPRAIAIAKSNARLNRIRGIRFEIADAKKPDARGKVDLIVANLFSELLIAAIPIWKPRLKTGGILILSGILRDQQREVLRRPRKSNFAIQEIRQRGKWIALCARVAQAFWPCV